MPRMLTEEDVEMIEKQRRLQERKAAAIAGMTDNERMRFREAEEREMWDRRYRETHGGLSRAEVAAAGPNGSGRQYRAIAQGFAEQRREAELQQARKFEIKKQGEEMGTRRFEAEQKKYGMREQGRDAAEFNKDATIRAEELRTAGAKEIAGINAASGEKIAGINAQSNENINKDKNDANIETERIRGEATVDAAREKTAGELARERAEDLVRRRFLKRGEAVKASSEEQRLAMQMVNQSKRRGRATISYEEALERVRRNRREPGTAKPVSSYEY